MNRAQYIAYRFGWTIVGAWGALTAIFFALRLTPDPGQYCLGTGCREAYREARNYDLPLYEQYLAWMESYLTLDLGTTIRGEPVADLLAEATTVTLTYLVPSVVVAVTIGVGVGTYVAMKPDRKRFAVVRGASYVGFAIPTFVAALALFVIATRRFEVFTLEYDHERAVFTSRNLVALTLPASVVVTKLLAVQLRYARSESVEILHEDFVRTLRSTGAGASAIARHVLKNGASSLLSLFFSELVGVVFVVVVVVEIIFNVPGFGQLLYRGIQQRDPGLILATTTFPILLIMFGNFLQDVAYSLIDPRIRTEESG